MPINDQEKPATTFAEFDAGTFHFIIDEHRAAFRSLHKLASDSETISIHLQKKNKEKELRVANNETLKLPDELEVNLHVLSVLSSMYDIQNAMKIFNQQTIVVLVSIIESMLQEFFQCVFCKHPLRMYEYLYPKSTGDALKGKIDLEELTQAPSREELIYSLASRASEVAMQGKFRSMLKILQQVTKNVFQEEILEKITLLAEQRNRIVHELSTEEISIQDVEDGFATMFELVEKSEQAAIQLNMPVAKINIDE
jgi:hypothetical protein